MNEEDLKAGGSGSGPRTRAHASRELQRPKEGDTGLGCGLEPPTTASAVEPQSEFGGGESAGPSARLVTLEIEEHGQAPRPKVCAPRAEGRGHGGVVLQEFHTQRKAAPKISPQRTQRTRRGRVVGAEVDAQQADSQGCPHGIVVTHIGASDGGRGQTTYSGYRSEDGRTLRLRLRLRPCSCSRSRPQPLLETPLKLSHDARVQGVALLKFGGEVG